MINAKGLGFGLCDRARLLLCWKEHRTPSADKDAPASAMPPAKKSSPVAIEIRGSSDEGKEKEPDAAAEESAATLESRADRNEQGKTKHDNESEGKKSSSNVDSWWLRSKRRQPGTMMPPPDRAASEVGTKQKTSTMPIESMAKAK